MEIRAEEISQIIKKQIEGFDATVELAETGNIISVGDGIARVYGLEKCMYGELLAFPGELFGMALNLETDNVGAVLLGDDRHVKEGDEVRRTGRIVQVPVGKALLGAGGESPGAAHRRERAHRCRGQPQHRADRPGRHRPPAGEGAPPDRESRPSTP